MSGSVTPSQLAARIDHANLKPEATSAEIRRLCQEAVQYNFASVCVNPCYIPLAVKLLGEENPAVGTVIDFPFGCSAITTKLQQIQQALAEGAGDLDIVAHYAMALEENWSYLENELHSVVNCAKNENPEVVLKLILETAALPEAAKIKLAQLAVRAGFHFLKTSTGFHPAGGATVADVQLLAEQRGGALVKASGGIRTLEAALELLTAGADRLGTSAGVILLRQMAPCMPY